MSQKTIAELGVFVILFCSLSACVTTTSAPPPDARSQYAPAVQIGTIRSPDITEASGLAASRCQKDVLWTHNDSGDDAFIFAVRPNGDALGTWKVSGARNIDWEDIATYKDTGGRCFVYIAETGNNRRERTSHAIYRVKEPLVTDDSKSSDRKHPLLTESAELTKFTYPDYEQDAETLLVHPKSGDIYVVTKRITGAAGVYKIKANFGSDAAVPAALLTEISVPSIPNGFVTGGDISPDGRRLIICDYVAAYEWTLPEGQDNFEMIFKEDPVTVDIGRRKEGEAVCYSVDGSALYATSEGRNAPIFVSTRK